MSENYDNSLSPINSGRVQSELEQIEERKDFEGIQFSLQKDVMKGSLEDEDDSDHDSSNNFISPDFGGNKGTTNR